MLCSVHGISDDSAARALCIYQHLGDNVKPLVRGLQKEDIMNACKLVQHLKASYGTAALLTACDQMKKLVTLSQGRGQSLQSIWLKFKTAYMMLIREWPKMEFLQSTENGAVLQMFFIMTLSDDYSNVKQHLTLGEYGCWADFENKVLKLIQSDLKKSNLPHHANFHKKIPEYQTPKDRQVKK